MVSNNLSLFHFSHQFSFRVGGGGTASAFHPGTRSRLKAQLIRDRWVKAWGKLPRASPIGPISSESASTDQNEQIENSSELPLLLGPLGASDCWRKYQQLSTNICLRLSAGALMDTPTG